MSAVTLLILIVFQLCDVVPVVSWWNFQADGICSGDNSGITQVRVPIETLRKKYQNCTIVTGNLEITNIKQTDLTANTLDFLQNIEEVRGYVIIYNTQLASLSLPKLKIIWGNELFSLHQDLHQNRSELVSRPFGLYVQDNQQLRVLDMRSLVAVHKGNVLFGVNPYLCYVRTIDWGQILSKGYGLVDKFAVNHEGCNEETPFCAAACSENHCWGPDAGQCQHLYRNRSSCAPQCDDLMCYRDDRSPLSCCHTQCIGGCLGPRSENCIFCRGFRNGNDCVESCPPIRKYNPATGEKEPNPEGKYHYNRFCVAKCPENMLIDYDSCVTRCRADHYSNDKRECVPCIGPCPKRCTITTSVHAHNIRDFENCTEVDGFIEILQSVGQTLLLLPDQLSVNATSVAPLDLQLLNLMQNVRKVTQFVVIQVGDSQVNGVDYKGPKSLSFLRNLEVIEGRTKFQDGPFSLYITGTSLESLDLVNLKEVRDGKILISQNPNLCYSHNIPFGQIAKEGYINTTKPFREPILCNREGKVCDASCVQDVGCWGAGRNSCYACRNFKLDGVCVDSCASNDNLFQVTSTVCERCNPQCSQGCSGPGADKCRLCRNSKDGNTCVAVCPTGSFPDAQNICRPCATTCSKQNPGCTGPSSIAGPGGCNRCSHAVLLPNGSYVCEKEDSISWSGCFINDPERRLVYQNFYADMPRTDAEKSMVDTMTCKLCHPLCRSCATFGAIPGDPGNNCMCRDFYDRTANSCVSKCASDQFARSSSKPYRDCVPCHNECDPDAGCNGTRSTDCGRCKHFHVFLNDGPNKFDCMTECPAEAPFPNDERICLSTDVQAVKQREQYTKIGLGVGSAIVLVAVICVIAFIMYRRRVDLRLRFAVPDLDLKPNPNAKPNLSYFHIINEADLRKGGELGAGAFGKVYKGVWICPLEGGGVKKRPVAIKVLHEASPTAVNEMLEEASSMASMHHQHLVPLLGMCVGSQMMLVTPLMPLGNLLEYVQNNKGSGQINSVHMMRWCRQIAEGMAYLEDHRLVHRDLAARNVLVQTPYVLRITDFGLAKMLDYGQDEYKAAGGKMPIKWLALECIKHRTFTHKSDVWAFAVTVWEILSFGEKPYENVPVKDLFSRIENGDRLPQIPTMTMDFYVLLIKCWMVDAESRPSFKELVEIFENWSSDPGRYIVIRGDRYGHLDNLTRDDLRERLREAVNMGELEDIDDDEYYSSSAPSGAMPSTPVKNGGPADRRVPFGSHNQRNHSTGSSRYGPEPKHFAAKHQPLNQADDNYLIPRCNMSSNDITPLSGSAVTAVLSDRGIPYTEVVSLSPGSNENSFNLGSPPPYYNCLPNGTGDASKFRFDYDPFRNGSPASVDTRKRNGNGNSLDNREYMAQPTTTTNGLYVNEVNSMPNGKSREVIENETVV